MTLETAGCLALDQRRQNIDGPEVVHALLGRARIGRGLDKAGGLRSLLIRSRRTLQGGPPRFETTRMLLPSRFQQVGRSTFTVIDDAYWQRPDPGESTRRLAELNTRKKFAEQVLVFGLTATATVPLRATVDRRNGSEVVVLFQGIDLPAFERRLTFDDRDGRLVSFEERGAMTQGDATIDVVRRVTVDKMESRAGVAFPVRMSETFGSVSAVIEVTEFVFNTGVAQGDFEIPR